MKLRDIAALINADIDPQSAAEVDVAGVGKIDQAGEGDVTFLANPKYARFLGATRASAVIVGRDVRREEGTTAALLRVDNPYLSFLKVLVTFSPPPDPLPPGIHPSAVVAPSAVLGRDVRIGANAVIGDGASIGDRTMVGHNAVVAAGAVIGPDCIVYHSVTVREGCRIGARVILQTGAVVGSDGFGFAPKADGTYEKIPQVGIVVIEDDVEIGANTTIDRATLGETRIKRGAKIDNLIQLAHNVVVGENTVMAAQAGISGSTKIGRNCMIGGQVGLVGHVEIADGTKIGAQSGVHRSVAEPNTTWFGSPAMPARQAFRVQGAVTQLPDLLVEVRALRKRIEELEEELRALRGAKS